MPLLCFAFASFINLQYDTILYLSEAGMHFIFNHFLAFPLGARISTMLVYHLI